MILRTLILLTVFINDPVLLQGRLVMGLGNNNFRAREAASAALQLHGHRAERLLRYQAQWHDDPEVRFRCRWLVEKLKKVEVERRYEECYE